MTAPRRLLRLLLIGGLALCSLPARAWGYGTADGFTYGATVWASGTGTDAWDQFHLIDLGGGYVALLAKSGFYVTVDASAGGALNANRTHASVAERFRLVDLGSGQIALQGANGLYVSAAGGGGGLVIANGATVGASETFLRTDLGNALVTLQASTGAYLSAPGAVLGFTLTWQDWWDPDAETVCDVWDGATCVAYYYLDHGVQSVDNLYEPSGTGDPGTWRAGATTSHQTSALTQVAEWPYTQYGRWWYAAAHHHLVDTWYVDGGGATLVSQSTEVLATQWRAADVTPLPYVTALLPPAGTIDTPVTVMGLAFGTAVGTVTINGAYATVTNWTNTSVTILVPPLAATGPVVVRTPTQTSNATRTFFMTRPTITGLAPSWGPEATTVVITGRNFGSSGTVQTHAAEPAFTVVQWADTEITVTVPAGVTTGPLTVTATAGTSNAPLFTVAEEQTRYLHTDAIGSVRLITDATGTVAERHDYLPFGDEWLPPHGEAYIGFGGKEKDPETGTGSWAALNYFGARSLHAASGRFTTADPVAWNDARLTDPQRANRYSYARQNPLRFVDPDGREPMNAAAVQFFGALFGVRYMGKVDIKFGPPANKAAKSIAGEGGAFTVGDSIYLSKIAADSYRPLSREGLALIGHELTHVVQYRRQGVTGFFDTYFGSYFENHYVDGMDHYTAYKSIPHEIGASEVQDFLLDLFESFPKLYEKIRDNKQFTNDELVLIRSLAVPMRRGEN